MTVKREKRDLQLEWINHCARTDPRMLVEQEHAQYIGQMEQVRGYLEGKLRDRLLIALSGPSSAGKTTSAEWLRGRLQEDGIEAYVVSLDDFYLGRERAPMLPDGSYDYETVEALNLPLLRQCMYDLMEQGRALLPRFDFQAGRPAPEKRELCLPHNAVVIFEGIHALNPLLTDSLGDEALTKIFVHTYTPICNGAEKQLTRRELRLCRRILRDARFRNSEIDNTLNMWPQVIRGEDLYLFPYVDTADIRVDTTFAFEPCMTAPLILPQLPLIRDLYPQWYERLALILSPFEAMDPALLPPDALLHEFLG